MASTSKNMIRIRLKAYDHQLIDKAAETIVEAAKRTDDLKFLSRWAKNHGCAVENCVMDSSLAGYILNVSGDDYSVGRLGSLYHAESFELSGETDAHKELLEKAAVFSDLCEKLRAELKSLGEEKILDEIELPLAEVLASMENEPINISTARKRFSGPWCASSDTSQRSVVSLESRSPVL